MTVLYLINSGISQKYNGCVLTYLNKVHFSYLKNIANRGSFKNSLVICPSTLIICPTLQLLRECSTGLMFLYTPPLTLHLEHVPCCFVSCYVNKHSSTDYFLDLHHTEITIFSVMQECMHLFLNFMKKYIPRVMKKLGS